MPMLEVTDIHTYYGNIEALKGVSLTVEEGEIVTLIGSNGAGQVDDAALDQRPQRPAHRLDPLPGREIARMAAAGDRLARRLAVARGPALLPAHDRPREPRPRRLPAQRRQGRDRRGHGPRLRPVPAPEGARAPEGGHDVRRRAADARHRPRADGRPQLLLLDEPSMGIAPILVDRIYETIQEINRQGMTILLVEQNANYALGVSKRAYVLETGQVALSDDVRLAAREPRRPEGLPRHMIPTVFALLGAKALYLTFLWLAAAIAASYLSDRKGYGEKPGLASGLILTVIGPIIWLFVPARAGSTWKRYGPFGRPQGRHAARGHLAPAGGRGARAARAGGSLPASCPTTCSRAPSTRSRPAGICPARRPASVLAEIMAGDATEAQIAARADRAADQGRDRRRRSPAWRRRCARSRPRCTPAATTCSTPPGPAAAARRSTSRRPRR